MERRRAASLAIFSTVKNNCLPFKNLPLFGVIISVFNRASVVAAAINFGLSHLRAALHKAGSREEILTFSF
jgi:hypothetical protein